MAIGSVLVGPGRLEAGAEAVANTGEKSTKLVPDSSSCPRSLAGPVVAPVSQFPLPALVGSPHCATPGRTASIRSSMSAVEALQQLHLRSRSLRTTTIRAHRRISVSSPIDEPPWRRCTQVAVPRDTLRVSISRCQPLEEDLRAGTRRSRSIVRRSHPLADRSSRPRATITSVHRGSTVSIITFIRPTPTSAARRIRLELGITTYHAAIA